MFASETERLIGALQALEPKGFETLREVWEYLRISELMMLDVLEGRPENPVHAGKGDPELGHFLFNLHYPHPKLLALAGGDAVAQAAWSLASHANKPASTIAPDYFDKLRAESAAWPIVRGNGTLWGFDQYESLDSRWVHALVNLAITLVHERHDFGTTPCTRALTPSKGTPVKGKPGEDKKIRLGIVGDWGTGIYGEGKGPAAAVMEQLAGLDCDYLFHLGDTYYAGTGAAPYVPGNEQISNFIQLWPQTTGPGRSFTLNSNHEMYSGGNGYFTLALGNDIFKHQNMTSYFALTFGKWVILGLDTAYNAPIGSLYLDGVLGEQQGNWIREYGKGIGGYADKKILVLTHHEGQNFEGGALTALHGEIAAALGRAPDVWYWGHLHNGIAYSHASAAGKLGTRARCVGHSAIPYGLSSALLDPAGQPIATVEYFARTPATPGGPYVLNGFATLELSESGGIAEMFYEQGRPGPVWQSANGTRLG